MKLKSLIKQIILQEMKSLKEQKNYFVGSFDAEKWPNYKAMICDAKWLFDHTFRREGSASDFFICYGILKNEDIIKIMTQSYQSRHNGLIEIDWVRVFSNGKEGPKILDDLEMLKLIQQLQKPSRFKIFIDEYEKLASFLDNYKTPSGKVFSINLELSITGICYLVLGSGYSDDFANELQNAIQKFKPKNLKINLVGDVKQPEAFVLRTGYVRNGKGMRDYYWKD